MARIMRRIANLAYAAEPDRQIAFAWMSATRIPFLDGRTAVDAAFDGQGDRVVSILRKLARGRGLPHYTTPANEDLYPCLVPADHGAAVTDIDG